jgi:Family of unknown function (DUF6152)
MKNTFSLARFCIVPLLLPLLAAALCPAAKAHHGNVGYDVAKTITLHGTATSFDWANPHCLLHMDVKDDNGNVQRWTLEMAPPSILSHRGWTKDSIRPGDQVTIDTHPAKNGIPLGISSSNSYILKAVVDGKMLPGQ